MSQGHALLNGEGGLMGDCGRAVLLVLALLGSACSEGEMESSVRQPGAPLEVIVHPQRDRLLSSSTGIRVLDIEPDGDGDSVSEEMRPLAVFDSARAMWGGWACGVDAGDYRGCGDRGGGSHSSCGRDYGTVRLWTGDAAGGRMGGFGEGTRRIRSPIGVGKAAGAAC